MSDDYSDLLYRDSPFYPFVSTRNLLNVNRDIDVNHRPLIVAVSFELLSIALDFNQIHIQNLEWILESFKAKVEDVDIFTFGYTMAPSLIIGSFISAVSGVPEGLKRICPPGTDNFLLRLNGYKVSHLPDVYAIFISTMKDPKLCGYKIFQFCFDKPFSDNRYYLAGLTAAKRHFLSLVSLEAFHH